MLELSVASNLLGVCIHTLPTCFHWYVVLVFTVELVHILVTIAGKIGTHGIVIRSLEPLSVASNLISGRTEARPERYAPFRLL